MTQRPCNNPDCETCRDRDLDRAEDFGFMRTEVERRDNVVPLPKRARLATEAERGEFEDNVIVLINCEDEND